MIIRLLRFFQAFGIKTFVPAKTDGVAYDVSNSIRTGVQTVYLWPSLTEREKTVLRDAFAQIARRTCVRFDERDWKPWYHAERWEENRPYVIIRKSNKYIAYSDNKIEDVAVRSILYVTDAALNHANKNQSRGMVIEQLIRFLGIREEHLRPDAPSYIQSIKILKKLPNPNFLSAQLMWPFDPESVSIPAEAVSWYELTAYCPGRYNHNIGAGQRVGLLTKWDAIKLNSMFCPDRVKNVDPRYGPCVVPRKV